MEQPVLLFGWFRWDILVEYKDLFWQGAWMTLRMTVVCVLLGASWGLCLALARLAQPRHAPWTWVARFFLRWPATVYVSFFRGTPLFVQILLIHFAVMPVFIHPTSGLLIDGDRAASFSRLTAIQLGTGRTISYHQAQFLHFRDGKIVEYRGIIDSFNAAEQMMGRPIALPDELRTLDVGDRVAV